MATWSNEVPLIKSGSKSAVSENIRRETVAGKPQKQAVAIALAIKDRAQRGIESKRTSLPSSGLPGLKGLPTLGANFLKRPKVNY